MFQSLVKVNKPKQKNIQVRKQKKWNLKKKKQWPQSLVYVYEQNKAKQEEQVNVLFIVDEERI